MRMQDLQEAKNPLVKPSVKKTQQLSALHKIEMKLNI